MTLITTKTITTITIALPVFSPLAVFLQYNVSPHLQEQSFPTQPGPDPSHKGSHTSPTSNTPFCKDIGVFSGNSCAKKCGGTGSATCVGNDCSCKCGDTLYCKQTASGENTGSSIVIVVIVLVVMSVIAGAGYYIYVKRLFFFSNSNDVYYNSLTDNQKKNLRQSLV
jgi:hypothetical protein